MDPATLEAAMLRPRPRPRPLDLATEAATDAWILPVLLIVAIVWEALQKSLRNAEGHWEGLKPKSTIARDRGIPNSIPAKNATNARLTFNCDASPQETNAMTCSWAQHKTTNILQYTSFNTAMLAWELHVLSCISRLWRVEGRIRGCRLIANAMWNSWYTGWCGESLGIEDRKHQK